MKKKVLIYRNHLLKGSETFIKDQVDALEKFDSIYVGLRTVAGINLPSDRVMTAYKHSPMNMRKLIGYRLCSRHSSFFDEVAQTSPSLIHAHFGPDGVKAMPLAYRLNIPLIVTMHGFDVTLKTSYAWHTSYSYFMYLLKQRKMHNFVTRFIAVSEFVKEKLIDRGFPKRKVTVHYVGVDTKKFSPTPTSVCAHKVLFVGRLIEVKGCAFLIEAVARVQTVVPDVELIVIGDGPLRESLKKLASTKLKKYCFLGFQSPSVVRKWMSDSKVFCVPSITASSGHEEAFGTVFVEAQATGLPVVSFDSGGISEAVEHEKTGFLAPEKNIEALSYYLLEVLRDSATWHRLSHNAIGRTREKFDIRKQTQKLEDFYLEAIDNQRCEM